MMSRLVLFVVSLGALFFCTSRREISIFIGRAACAPPCDDPQPPFSMNIISSITAFSCPAHFPCALTGRLLRRHMQSSSRPGDDIPRKGFAYKFRTLGVVWCSACRKPQIICSGETLCMVPQISSWSFQTLKLWRYYLALYLQHALKFLITRASASSQSLSGGLVIFCGCMG